MGDGQHVWAAAEWVLMVRNMFVREEEENKTLILCSGIPPAWLKEGETLFLGPTLTLFGKISITVKVERDKEIRVSWHAQWHKEPPAIEVHWPGQPVEKIAPEGNSVLIRLNQPSRSAVPKHAVHVH